MISNEQKKLNLIANLVLRTTIIKQSKQSHKKLIKILMSNSKIIKTVACLQNEAS